MRWLEQIFCTHRFEEFVRNIYGDEINAWGGRRSIWSCSHCGVRQGRDELREEASQCRVCCGKGWNDEYKAVDGRHDGGEVFRIECDACEGSGRA